MGLLLRFFAGRLSMVRAFQNKSFLVQYGFYIIIALALLIVPVRWVIGWFLAVFFHEFSHYIALRLYKVPVFQITVGAFGADIQTGEMTIWQEIICALAGPIGSLVLLLLLRVFPYVSLCALGQALFNLIPIYPMDGGRAVTCICVALLGERNGLLFSKAISNFFLILLLCASLLTSLHYKLGVLPIAIAALIVVRALKFPCKDGQLIVQ